MRKMTDEERSEWRAANWPLDTESTDYLCVWLVNDCDPLIEALDALNEEDDPTAALEALASVVLDALNSAPKDSGGWHTRRELSENDLGRIDWPDIAETLLAE